MRLREQDLDRPLADAMAHPPGNAPCLYWLGQAGFVIDGAHRRVVIDPYLSNSLEEKYRGTATPHVRMMPPPVAPGGIAHIDLILSTHAHTDHLDAPTLRPLLAANPNAVMVAAAASGAKAIDRSGLTPPRLILVDAGERLRPVEGVEVTVTRAAHESLERDDQGRHMFLGYAIGIGGVTIFHSGDTIPFPGQVEEVASLSVDLALLPVNGRDAVRARHGIPGNMTAAEAMSLARSAGIPDMIAHHFGMFAFNTVPRDAPEALCGDTGPTALHPARTEVRYRIDTGGDAAEERP